MLKSTKLKLFALVLSLASANYPVENGLAHTSIKEETINRQEVIANQYVGFGKAIAIGLEKVSYDYADYWEMYLNSDRMSGVINESVLEDWARRACSEAQGNIDIAEVDKHFRLLYIDFVMGFTSDIVIRANKLGTTPISSLVDPKEIYGLVLQEAVTIQCPEKPIIGVLNLNR
jgi:hypothetical protein